MHIMETNIYGNRAKGDNSMRRDDFNGWVTTGSLRPVIAIVLAIVTLLSAASCSRVEKNNKEDEEVLVGSGDGSYFEPEDLSGGENVYNAGSEKESGPETDKGSEKDPEKGFGMAFNYGLKGKGINREKISKKSAYYPVELHIGNLSFKGKLARDGNLTDVDIDKVIKDTLGEMGMTENDIGQLEELVSIYERGERLPTGVTEDVIDNARRILDEFYDKADQNAKMASLRTGNSWNIVFEDATDQKNFIFYNIDGNIEKWKVNLHLQKEDTPESKGPGGLYEGFVRIDVDYDLTSYDSRFMEEYFFVRDENAKKAVKGLKDFGAKFNDDYQASKVSRKLYSRQNISLRIDENALFRGTVTVYPDFSDFSDEREIDIYHKVIASINKVEPDGQLVQTQIYEFYTRNEEILYDKASIIENYMIENGVRRDIALPYSPTLDPQERDWDRSIWEHWEKSEKSLVINFDEEISE